MTESYEPQDLFIKFTDGYVEVKDGELVGIQNKEQTVLSVKAGVPAFTRIKSDNQKNETFYYHVRKTDEDNGLVVCKPDEELAERLSSDLGKEQLEEAIIHNISTFFLLHPEVKTALKGVRLPASLGGTVIESLPDGDAVEPPDYCKKAMPIIIDLQKPKGIE